MRRKDFTNYLRNIFYENNHNFKAAATDTRIG